MGLAKRSQSAPAFNSCWDDLEERSNFRLRKPVSSKKFDPQVLLMHKNGDQAFWQASKWHGSAQQARALRKLLIHMGFIQLPILEANPEKPMPARLWRHCTKSINKVIPKKRGQPASAHPSAETSLIFQRPTSPAAPFLEVVRACAFGLSTDQRAFDRRLPHGAARGRKSRRPLFSFGFSAAAQHRSRNYGRVIASPLRHLPKPVNKVVHRIGRSSQKNQLRQ